MATNRTPARTARQAALIRTWKPWEQATGPRTPDGQGQGIEECLEERGLADAARAVAQVSAEIGAARELVESA